MARWGFPLWILQVRLNLILMKNFLFLSFLLIFKSSVSQLKLVCDYNPEWSYNWFHNKINLNIKSNVIYSIGKNVSGDYMVMVSNKCDTTYSEIKIKKPKDKNEYHLLISDLDECQTSFLDLFDDEWHINLESPLSFIIFPNPTKSMLNFRVYRGISSTYQITIYDHLGKKVIEKTLNKEDQIDISFLSKGMYIFEAVSDNSKKCEIFIVQ